MLHTRAHHSLRRDASPIIKPSKVCSTDHTQWETGSFTCVRPSDKNPKDFLRLRSRGGLHATSRVGIPNGAEHADRQPCHGPGISEEGEEQTRWEEADGQK